MENLTDIVLKKFVAIEMIAIKLAFILPKTTPHMEYLKRMHNGGIIDTLNRRRKNFVLTNRQSLLIRQVETTVHSAGRRIRVKKVHVDRSAPRFKWKRRLRHHKRHIFFSDPPEEDEDLAPSIARLLHPENFTNRPNPLQENRTTKYMGGKFKFVCKLAYDRRRNFNPG